jgi:hypothetical protein
MGSDPLPHAFPGIPGCWYRLRTRLHERRVDGYAGYGLLTKHQPAQAKTLTRICDPRE